MSYIKKKKQKKNETLISALTNFISILNYDSKENIKIEDPLFKELIIVVYRLEPLLIEIDSYKRITKSELDNARTYFYGLMESLSTAIKTINSAPSASNNKRDRPDDEKKDPNGNSSKKFKQTRDALPERENNARDPKENKSNSSVIKKTSSKLEVKSSSKGKETLKNDTDKTEKYLAMQNQLTKERTKSIEELNKIKIQIEESGTLLKKKGQELSTANELFRRNKEKVMELIKDLNDKKTSFDATMKTPEASFFKMANAAKDVIETMKNLKEEVEKSNKEVATAKQQYETVKNIMSDNFGNIEKMEERIKDLSIDLKKRGSTPISRAIFQNSASGK